MHTLVGAGKADGAMDASNLLKPALARGELHCIGATTLDEYKKHVEKDAALARRFQPIFVDEPTVEDTISILRGLKEKYEAASRSAHHRPAHRRGGDAVEPLHHRPLPARQGDRSGRRGGGAAARCRSIPSRKSSTPSIARSCGCKIEQEALKKETRRRFAGAPASARGRACRRWRSTPPISPPLEVAKRTNCRDAQKLKNELDQLRVELANAQRRGEYQRAGELAYGRIPELEKKLKDDRSRRRQAAPWSRRR